ncbi:hypothetical protein [Prochlorococcus marinus]|uniref:hypothetical protein n=1 Tax=Prochlorococcus marinus TaxID=1219 RepID=UPI0007B3BF51|nr:hypothetical protein [Prochlorococcus marinus]KZR73697.1 hypothetical protein PMIT1320_02292 [Prochlorococcus marinus str. MIT 1320]
MASILLPVHVWDREFDSRIVIGTITAAMGNNVIIGHEYNLACLYERKYQYPVLFRAGGPLNHSVRGAWHKKITESDGMVITQDEEGINNLPLRFIESEHGIYVKLNKERVKKALHQCKADPEVYKNVACQLAWGNLHRAYMANIINNIESRSIGVNRILSCSGVRFDLLGEFGSKLNRRLSTSIRNVYNDYVLFMDNFSVGQKMNPSSDLKQAGFTESEINNFINTRKGDQKREEEARSNFGNILIRLAKSNPHIQYILRPHPVLDPTFWLNKFSAYKNISVICKGSVTPWIYGAVCTVHSGCTTGLEAYGAMIPTIDISHMIGDRAAHIRSSLIGQAKFKPDEYHVLEDKIREVWKKRKNSEQNKNILSIKSKEFHRTSDQHLNFNIETVMKILQENCINVSKAICAELNLINGSNIVGDTSGISTILNIINTAPTGKDNEKEFKDMIRTLHRHRNEQYPPNLGKSRYVSLEEVQMRVEDVRTALLHYGTKIPKIRVHSMAINLFSLRR